MECFIGIFFKTFSKLLGSHTSLWLSHTGNPTALTFSLFNLSELSHCMQRNCRCLCWPWSSFMGMLWLSLLHMMKLRTICHHRECEFTTDPLVCRTSWHKLRCRSGIVIMLMSIWFLFLVFCAPWSGFVMDLVLFFIFFLFLPDLGFWVVDGVDLVGFVPKL